MMKHEEMKAKLESLVDETRLSKVLCFLAEICAEKAVHIETNWQDVDTAKPWRAACQQIETLEQKVYKAGL